VPAIKRLSFIRGVAGLDADHFDKRWREHALRELATTPPTLRPMRVAHCLTRRGRTAPLYDAVSISWFADQTVLSAYDRHHAAAAPAIEPIMDPAASWSVLVEERCVFGNELLVELWQLPRGSSRLLLVGLMKKAAGLSRAEFADYWWHRHRPLANRLFPAELQPPLYLHNYVLPDESCAWDGIGELYESSLDSPRRRNEWMNSVAAAPIAEDEERFMERATRAVLVTDFELVIGDDQPLR
jgi:hypothetical protein